MIAHTEQLFDEIISKLPPDDGMWPEWPEPDDADPDGDWLGSAFEEGTVRPFDPSEQSGAGGLSPEAYESAERALRTYGLDVLAFYKSRRKVASPPYRGMWGIFYRSEGLDHVAHELSQVYPGRVDYRVLARDFLREHEIFHFRADIQPLLFESTLKRHLYLPLRRALRGRGTHFVEEALANRHAYRWSVRHELKDFAADFMDRQPNAYARFGKPLLELTGEWAANVVDQNPPGCPPRHDLAHWITATPSMFEPYSACPQHEILRQTHGGSLFPSAWPVPPVKQIDDTPRIAASLRRHPQIAAKWQDTKQQLIDNPDSRGLNFKRWHKGGKRVYSVRLDLKSRAHLEHLGQGLWSTIEVGAHDPMGHG